MENQQEQPDLQAPIADFLQQPYWGADDKINIKGSDFEILYNFVQMFGPAVDAARRTMQSNITSEVVKMRYVKEDGTEVPHSYVVEFEKKWDAYIAQMRKRSEDLAANPLINEMFNKNTANVDQESTSNIVNMHNEPVKSEDLANNEPPIEESNNEIPVPAE